MRNVPILSEVYPELDYLGWFAVYAATGTPDAIVRKMAAEMNKVAAQEDLREFFLKLALTPNPGTPEALATLTRKDYERYGALVRKLNVRMDCYWVRRNKFLLRNNIIAEIIPGFFTCPGRFAR